MPPESSSDNERSERENGTPIEGYQEYQGYQVYQELYLPNMHESSELLLADGEFERGVDAGIRKDLQPSREALEPYEPKASWWGVNPKLAHHGIHDIGHATRTLIWSDVLANSWEDFLREESGLDVSQIAPVNRKVLRLASSAHDIGRRADVEPLIKTHAHVGAKLFHETWQNIDPTLQPDEVGKIENLLYNHCGESLYPKVADKVKTITRRFNMPPQKDPTLETSAIGIPSPVELDILRMADGGLEAFRVYDKKATIPGRMAVAGFTGLANQFAGSNLPDEYLALRNRVWLPGSKETGIKPEAQRPGARDLVPLAMQLYRESTADKVAYRKDPFNTTLNVAERLGIVKS